MCRITRTVFRLSYGDHTRHSDEHDRIHNAEGRHIFSMQHQKVSCHHEQAVLKYIQYIQVMEIQKYECSATCLEEGGGRAEREGLYCCQCGGGGLCCCECGSVCGRGRGVVGVVGGCCGGADVVLQKRVCPSSCTRVQITWTRASALVPSAGLSSQKPYACSPRKKQVPGKESWDMSSWLAGPVSQCGFLPQTQE